MATKKQTITKPNTSEMGITNLQYEPMYAEPNPAKANAEPSMYEQDFLPEQTPEIVTYATMLNNSPDEPAFVKKHSTSIFKSIWKVTHGVIVNADAITHDEKEKKFDQGRTGAYPQRGDHFIKLKDGTIILCEYMSNSGKWDFGHQGQIMTKGAYLKKTYPGKKIIVMAIAGKITEDFIKDMHEMNKDVENLIYIPVELHWEVEPKNKGRIKSQIPPAFKNSFQKLIGTKTNKTKSQKDFGLINKAINTEKYQLKIYKNHATVSIEGIKVSLEPINLNAIKLYVSKPTLEKYPALNNTFLTIKNVFNCEKLKDGLKFNNNIEKNDERLSETFDRIAKTINLTK